MIKTDYIQKGVSLLTYKAPKKVQKELLGYVHADGKISFATSDAAQNYAKNRVVKALNSEKPFERGLMLQGNTVLCECNGNGSSVMFPTKTMVDGDYITVHGHPDEYIEIEEKAVKTTKDKIKKFFHLNRQNKKEKNGIALPISIQDYRSFMLNPNERKAIVYNSKGEYSILEKIKSGQFMNDYEFKELENEYKVEVSTGISRDVSNCLFQIKKLFYNVNKANAEGIERAKKHSQEIHEFLLNHTPQVRYKTNYSNLTNKN